MGTHSDDTGPVRILFNEHVPEVASGAVVVRRISRETGMLALVAVDSDHDAGFDAVGACVGPRGVRLKAIMQELGGRELLSVIRWSESTEQLISNLMAPARVTRVSFDEQTEIATVVLDRNFVSPSRRSPEIEIVALKLASQLTGWNIRTQEIAAD